MCAPKVRLMDQPSLGLTIYLRYGFWISYFGQFLTLLNYLAPFLPTITVLAWNALSSFTLSFIVNLFNPLSLFSFSYLQPNNQWRVMITSTVSGKGGPMLLTLRGRLGGSGVWYKWPWNWFPLQQSCSTAVHLEPLPCSREMVPRAVISLLEKWFTRRDPGDVAWYVLMKIICPMGFNVA